MKRIAALFVAVLFALSLAGSASAGEMKKDAPEAKEATTMKKDNTVEKETKAGKEGKKDDAKPKKKKKEAAGC
jgi:hypothetical protein